MKITWGKLKETNPELAEQVAFSICDDSIEAVPFDDSEELDLDLSEVIEQSPLASDQLKEVDVNGDGDTDVTIMDTNDSGTPDTAVVTADSEKEQKEAIKAAKDELDIDEQTSTGKTKKELDDQTVSDMRQKNVLSALLDHRF